MNIARTENWPSAKYHTGCPLYTRQSASRQNSTEIKVIDLETRHVNDDFILLDQLQITNRLITINLTKGYFMFKQKFPDFAKSEKIATLDAFEQPQTTGKRFLTWLKVL